MALVGFPDNIQVTLGSRWSGNVGLDPGDTVILQRVGATSQWSEDGTTTGNRTTNRILIDFQDNIYGSPTTATRAEHKASIQAMDNTYSNFVAAWGNLTNIVFFTTTSANPFDYTFKDIFNATTKSASGFLPNMTITGLWSMQPGVFSAMADASGGGGGGGGGGGDPVETVTGTDPDPDDPCCGNDQSPNTVTIIEKEADPYEYGFAHGGKWYYSQNKPGSAWVDKASNSKGWTVDFNLEVLRVENSDFMSVTDPPDGLGVYLNDGTKQETIYFFEQEIVFVNADTKITFDTTQETNYRVIGRGNGLKLYVRRGSVAKYELLAEIGFMTKASDEGNSFRPAIYEDNSGVQHAVWHDDGNVLGQILYSKFVDGAWITPEVVVSTSFGAQNADIAVDNDGTVHIAFETKETDTTSIAFMTRTDIGWSRKELLGVEAGNSKRPRMALDSDGNVHIVWEDHRFGHPEVFYNKFLKSTLSFTGEKRISDTSLGAFRPVVATYFDRAYIAWTLKAEESSLIQVTSYNENLDLLLPVVDVNEGSDSKSDYADILASVSGKVFIAWHDRGEINPYLASNEFEIFSRIYNPDLAPVSDIEQISDTANDSRFPVLSERKVNGDIFVAWEENLITISMLDPYIDPYLDPDAYLSLEKPSPCANILLAQYDSLGLTWISSANGNEDIALVAPDARTFSTPAVPSQFDGSLHILYSSMNTITTEKDFTRFAVIGDYGAAELSAIQERNAESVANMVKSFDPDFILTVGDNDYETISDISGNRLNTYDKNVGRFYSNYIGNYVGDFASGAGAENRFFPTPGNHDWENDDLEDYSNYFTLPGRANPVNSSGRSRYYNFRWENIEFFAVSSDDREPDGNTASSVQGQWLKNALQFSTAQFKIVYFHHSPYGSDATHPDGANDNMRWPFKEWGADIVLSGHVHLYERLFIDNFHYIIVGTGGHSVRTGGEDFGQMTKIPSTFGALIVDVDKTCATFSFFDTEKRLLDSVTIQKASTQTDPYFDDPDQPGEFLPDEYLMTNKIFSHIKDAVFDVTGSATHVLFTEDDLTVSDQLNKKEIRFGDFSNVLSAKFRFRDFKYYLDDAVGPFEIVPLSNKRYDVDDTRSSDVVVNNSSNAWVGTPSGLLFYFNPEESLTEIEPTKNVLAATFDRNNTLFYAWLQAADPEDENSQDEYKVSYSLDHMTHADLTLDTGSGDGDIGTITSLAFDKDNKLLVGTSDNGVHIFTTATSGGAITATFEQTILSELNSSFVNSVKVDELNAYWIATRGGLSRFLNGKVVTFTNINGLPSNRVHDIAIRNSAIRYLATANGISKMVGTSFETISAGNSDIANNNVKSIAWQEPNILWAGTLSKLNQLVEQPDGTFTSKSYGADYYSLENLEIDDKKNFFIVADEDANIDENSLVEVYINGNRITHGFTTSLSNPLAMIVQFDVELLETDEVDVVIRNDVTLLTSFAQSDQEKQELGANVIRVKSIATDGESIYVTTVGDENIVKVNDTENTLPHDQVHFDETPPSGCLEIIDQLDLNTVQVRINDATDGDNGSGVDKMVLSTFSNFTSDGTTPLEPVPFSPTAIVDLGLSVGEGGILAEPVTETFDFASGTGAVLRHFSDTQQTYAGTSNPAQLFKRTNSTGDWELITTFGASESIDFIERFNGRFIIGIGNTGSNATIHSFLDDGLFTDPIITALTGTRAFAAKELNGVLYIGSGPDGKLYSFDGESLTVVTEGISDNIYDLAAATSELFAATGDEGRVYRIDPIEPVASISHTDSDDAITAAEVFPFNDTDLVFVGTSSEGKLLRSEVRDASFNKTFQTVSSRANAIKRAGTELFSAIGDTVYSFSDSGVWVWRYTHTEDVRDVAINTANGTFFVISDGGIRRIGNPTTGGASEQSDVKIYLKLIDRATNETSLFNDSGVLVDCFFESITIEDLIAGSGGDGGFINENKILELDDLGTIVSTISGESKFYSADKIEQECGKYFSEIFNGTNELIKWDTISWTATEPANTTVNVYVRTSSSETDILAADWVGPFNIDQSIGVDLSFLTGQYIQFRVDLKSSEKGISPSLRNILIKSVTSEAVHFFTTNFILPSRLKKGILTGQKMLPVASDIVFGVNTTDSVSWSDYQIIDENRIFQSNQFGEGLRVGVRLITPSRSALLAAEFDEYGPYGSNLYINTIDFDFLNSGSTDDFHFRITLYEDAALTMPVFQAFSSDSQDGFSVDGAAFPSSGVTVTSGSEERILFTVPSSAGVSCGEFFFVKIEAYDGTTFTTEDDASSFISGCSASFVDNIDFDFTNDTTSSNDYHFRVKFYNDPERTDLFLTEFSGNNRTGWFIGASQIPEGGVTLAPSETTDVTFVPDLDKLEPNKLYYLTIDAYDGTDFTLASNSFTFQAQNFTSLIYCGPYIDVPVLKNFALMFELLNNEFITLNLN